MSEQLKRPVVATGIRTEFGDVLAEDVAAERAQDVTHVPGFTDLKIANDLARKEGRSITPLPVNLRWTRVTKVSGENDTTKAVQSGVRGYKPVTKDEIGQPWLTSMPAGASLMPDGTIRLGDCQLMVCDQKTAGRNEVRKLKNMMDLATTELDGGGAIGRMGGEVEKLPDYSGKSVHGKK